MAKALKYRIEFYSLDNQLCQVDFLFEGYTAGVVTYFLLEISIRILAYSGLAPIFAVLLPISLIILIGNFVILHFHES